MYLKKLRSSTATSSTLNMMKCRIKKRKSSQRISKSQSFRETDNIASLSIGQQDLCFLNDIAVIDILMFPKNRNISMPLASNQKWSLVVWVSLVEQEGKQFPMHTSRSKFYKTSDQIFETPIWKRTKSLFWMFELYSCCYIHAYVKFILIPKNLNHSMLLLH